MAGRAGQFLGFTYPGEVGSGKSEVGSRKSEVGSGEWGLLR